MFALSNGSGLRSVKACPSVDILLISGLHANERCAPLLAREVYRMLRQGAFGVCLVEIPFAHTLLALLDDPAAALPVYSLPAGMRRLDMDLDALDLELRRRYPGALAFEFHNAEDTHPMLGIEPARPVSEYEIGTIGPVLERSYEIGTWRNIDPDGRPGKFLIELPACYVPVSPGELERRREHLARLLAAGYEFDPNWLHYLERVTDVEASRRRGYLDSSLAAKVAQWIMNQHSSCGVTLEARQAPGQRGLVADGVSGGTRRSRGSR